MSGGPTHRCDGDRMRFYESASAALVQAREASGLSMRELARQSGVNRSTLESIERGQMPLSLYIAARIAETLDITIDALAPVLIAEKEAAE